MIPGNREDRLGSHFFYHVKCCCDADFRSQTSNLWNEHTDKYRYRSTFGAHFFENFHEKMKFPKSIQDHSGSIPQGPGHQKTFKNLQILPWEGPWGFRKKSEKIIRKHRFERLFGPIFSNFPMLAHVLSLRGDSRAFLLLRT